MEKMKFLPKNKMSKIPKTPGVYVLRNGNCILYIGKAANLKERIKSHFNQPSYKDSFFINKVKKIGYIKTDSEIEALIKESELIKKHKPKYNILWKDDKNYFYVGFSKEKFPRVFITHQPKDSTHIGPFTEGTSLKQTLNTLRKVFPFRTCIKLPRKSCLWYQLKRCPAPCLLQSDTAKQIPLNRIKREYRRNTNSLAKILQGKKSQVARNLKKEMQQFSKEENFEEAGRIKNQVLALEKVLAHGKFFESRKTDWPKIQKSLCQLLKQPAFCKKYSKARIEAYDISNIQGKEATGSMVVFVDGKPEKSLYRKFKIKGKKEPNDVAMMKEVLKRRFSHPEWQYPDLILVDGGKAQLGAAKNKFNIPILALAKKKNELYFEKKKNPILLKNLPKEVSDLILNLRDEAHRFAISYHRKLRKVDLFSSV